MRPSRIFQFIRETIFDGLIVVLPITITGYLLWLGYNLIDRFFGRDTVIGAQLSRSLDRLFGIEWIPGLSVIYTVIVILLFGLISKIYLGRLAQKNVNTILQRLPLIKRIYQPAQEISEAILGRGKFSSFKDTVMFEYPREGSYTIGFITNHIGDNVAVYIFSAPNPFTGKLFLVPEEDVTYLDITIEEGIKLVVSMGISSPYDREETSGDSGSAGVNLFDSNP